MELTLVMKKGKYDMITFRCKNNNHFNKLLLRFKNKGYKQIPYVTPETETQGYPF